MDRAVTERPRVTGPIYELSAPVKRDAAIYTMRHEHRDYPETMWEVLAMLGLDSEARRYLAEQDGIT